MATNSNARKGYLSYFNNIVNAGPPILKKYFEYISGVKGVSLNTASNYYRDLILFFRFVLSSRGKEFDLSDLKPEKDYEEIVKIVAPEIHEVFVHSIRRDDIIGFLQHMNFDEEASPTTRNRRLTAIKNFFDYAEIELKIIDYNPSLRIPSARRSKKLPIYLTLPQSQKLLEAVPRDSKHYFRDYCILVFFLNFGLRLSELVGINLSDIDATDRIVNLNRIKIRGKGNKERFVSFNEATMDAFKNYMNSRSFYLIKNEARDALFISDAGTRISIRRVNDIVHECIARSGIRNDSITPHKLRHTAATLMYLYGGVDINSLKDVLGHEDIGTTQIYTHTDDTLVREATSRNPLASFTKEKK